MLKSSALNHAIKQFLDTTTLHGFKYLNSRYYGDRICWLVCFCASACCAGLLCAVLWDRFQQVPALLTLQDVTLQDSAMSMPLVAVCPTPERLADIMMTNMKVNSTMTGLSAMLTRMLSHKHIPSLQLLTLQDFLAANNVTPHEALVRYTPPCNELLIGCRWQHTLTPCDDLFSFAITDWGACCVMRPDKVKLIQSTGLTSMVSIIGLDLRLQCFNGTVMHSCLFYTQYDFEDWIDPLVLSPGYMYMAILTFTSLEDADTENLFDGTCVSSSKYTRHRCLMKCTEDICGCSNPLRTIEDYEMNVPPPCPLTKYNCLITARLGNKTCKCLPSCKQVLTSTSLVPTTINALNDTLDPLYHNLNITSTAMLNFRVRTSGSKIFTRTPTETWLTLLSSLGGVFNMFLGVGLYSGLEILFLLLVRVPAAIRRSTELELPTATVQMSQ